MKSVNACISAAVSGPLRPSRPAKATLNFLNARSSSKAPPSGCTLGSSRPPVRSPRQCIGPWLAMPRRLCVVIGPFIGWKSGFECRGRARIGFWLSSTTVVRVAEIPGQAVEVAEDVAARARRLAVAGGEGGVVEEAAGRRRRWPARDCRAALERRAPRLLVERVDDRDRVVEAGQHVEAVVGLVEHQAGRAAAARAAMCCTPSGGVSGSKVSFSSLAVSKTPIFCEPKAAT